MVHQGLLQLFYRERSLFSIVIAGFDLNTIETPVWSNLVWYKNCGQCCTSVGMYIRAGH